MKKLLSLIVSLCISNTLSARILELGLSAGVLKYTIPVVSDSRIFMGTPTTSMKPMGSVQALLLIPHSGFSVGVGADIHNISVKSTFKSQAYLSSIQAAGELVTTTYFARPLVPLYLKLQQQFTVQGAFSLLLGINGGFVFVPAQHHPDRTEAHLPAGISYAMPQTTTGKGSGFLYGFNVAACYRITKRLSVNLATSPRYYSIKSIRTATYLQYSTFIDREKIQYHTFAIPVTAGVGINI